MSKEKSLAEWIIDEINQLTKGQMDIEWIVSDGSGGIKRVAAKAETTYSPTSIAWEIASQTRLQVESYAPCHYSIGYSWHDNQGESQWKSYLTFTEEHALDLIAHNCVESFIERSVRTISQMMQAVGNQMIDEFLTEEKRKQA